MDPHAQNSSLADFGRLTLDSDRNSDRDRGRDEARESTYGTRVVIDESSGTVRLDRPGSNCSDEEHHDGFGFRSADELEELSGIVDDRDLEVLERMHIEQMRLARERKGLPPTPPNEGQEDRGRLWREHPVEGRSEKVSGRKQLHLPFEIITQILGFVRWNDQKTFAAAIKVSRMWYSATLPFLYYAPRISPRNYRAFVATLCPSVTLVKPSHVAEYVRVMDLSNVVDENKPSYLPRLLRRVAKTLREFMAPKGAFNYHTYNALSNCRELRVLDLSSVSHSMRLKELILSIKSLEKLRVFKFPRSSFFDRGDLPLVYEWPDSLRGLFISGTISDTFFSSAKLPPNLTELSISHCPFARKESITRLITRLSSQLTSVTVNVTIPCLPYNAMDGLLAICPYVQHVTIAVDFITSQFFNNENNTPVGHPLRTLSLDSSNMPGTEQKLCPDDIFIPLADGRLSNLRIIRYSARLGWNTRYRKQTRDLVFLLDERRTEDIQRAKELGLPEGSVSEAGIWEFKSGGEHVDWNRCGGYQMPLLT